MATGTGVGSSVDINSDEYRRALAGVGAESTDSIEAMTRMSDQTLGRVNETANQMMTGALPDDVQRQIRTMAAERSVASGLGTGSQAARNMTARDLGLSSLQLAQSGATLGLQTTQEIERRRQFGVSSALQQQELSLRGQTLIEESRQANQTAQLQRQQLRASLGETIARAVEAYQTIGARYSENTRDVSGSVTHLSEMYRGLLDTLRGLL